MRQRLAWIRLAALLLLLTVAAPFFVGQVYTRDDLGEFHLPVRDFYARQLEHGQAFDWWPAIYSGCYITGEGQLGGYHPLHWLLYRWLPLGAAFDLEVLSNYVVLLAGGYGLLRRLLRQRDAALLGSLIFAFSGFNLLHFVHPNAVAVVAHIPLLLWMMDIAWTSDSPRRRALAELAYGLLTASELLLGYPQYVWFSLISEFGFAFWRARNIGPWRGVAVRLLLAKACGVLAGGVQLLPTMDALAHSTRSTVDADFTTNGSLHPLNLAQWFAPYLFETRVVGQNTHELGLYAGAVPCLLCAWLIARRGQLGRLRPLALAGLCLGLVGLWLAGGKYTGSSQLQSWLPGVGHFRFPCRAIVLIHLAIAVEAAIAFALICRQCPRASSAEHKKISQPVWAVLVISTLLACIGPLLWGAYTSPVWMIVYGPAVFFTAAWLLRGAESGRQWAAIALALLTAGDQGLYGLSYAFQDGLSDLNQFVAATRMPPAGHGNRVSLATVDAKKTGPRFGNRITLAGWRRVDGYAGLEPSKSLDYASLPALRLAGANWSISPAAETNALGERASWAHVESNDARARLVSNKPDGQTASAVTIADEPGHMVFRTAAAARRTLVVSESYHSGWQANIDGHIVPVVRVDGDFMGCVVDAGEHRVTFDFRPASLWWGKLASFCGLGLLLSLSATTGRFFLSAAPCPAK